MVLNEIAKNIYVSGSEFLIRILGVIISLNLSN